MKFTRVVFGGAAIYGFLVLLPQYFLEERIGRDRPPPLSHPEYFYGFVGVALAFQVLFVAIARDPVRLRPAMIAAIVEKASFGVAAIALYAAGRLDGTTLAFGLFDLVLAALFVGAWLRTPRG